MKIRELLRYEIWSKQITRKILVWSGIYSGVVIVVFGAWFSIEHFWMTPGERRAAQAALAQIDGLNHYESMSEQEFDVGENQAGVKIDAAMKAAWTIRDRRVVTALSAYLGLIEIGQEAFTKRKQLYAKPPALTQRDVLFDLELESKGKQSTLMVGWELHNILDK